MTQLSGQQKAQDTLFALASDTGGLALANSTDDASLYQQSEDADQVRYLVAYQPVNPKHDGKFHKFEVKCSRPGVRLSYPQGYWAPKSK